MCLSTNTHKQRAGGLGVLLVCNPAFWRRQWHPTPVLLAWRIPWAEEAGGLQSMGPLGVGHD